MITLYIITLSFYLSLLDDYDEYKSIHVYISSYLSIPTSFFTTLSLSKSIYLSTTGCSFNIVFFSNSRNIATSPSPALGCYYWLYKKLPEPIGVTVHSYCVRSFESRDVGEGGVAVNFEKKQIFSWTPCCIDRGMMMLEWLTAKAQH